MHSLSKSSAQYKIECRVTIELLDTESDETEKSVSYVQEWSSYVERYSNPGTGPAGTPGQNNGSSGYASENKAGISAGGVSTMETSLTGDGAASITSLTTTSGGSKCANSNQRDGVSGEAGKDLNSSNSGLKKSKGSAHSASDGTGGNSRENEESVSFSKATDASSSIVSGAPQPPPTPSSLSQSPAASVTNIHNKSTNPSKSREFLSQSSGCGQAQIVPSAVVEGKCGVVVVARNNVVPADSVVMKEFVCGGGGAGGSGGILRTIGGGSSSCSSSSSSSTSSVSIKNKCSSAAAHKNKMTLADATIAGGLGGDSCISMEKGTRIP